AESRKAVSDLWYKKGDDADESTASSSRLPKSEEAWLERLDDRLDELDMMTSRLDGLREGILEDRAAIKELMLDRAGKQTEAAGSSEPSSPAASKVLQEAQPASATK
ncbi:unnamed protein product, partial [Polarella glacialis]